MDLRQIRTFLTVATLLNFNRSAIQLNYSQSAVSAQIQSLEDYFGVPLFNRVSKKVNLTEAGQVFFRYAQKLMSLHEEAKAKVCNPQSAKGLLSLRVPQSLSTYYLPLVIDSFSHHYPNISIDVSTCAFHVLQEELRSCIVDIAFLLSDSFSEPSLNTEAIGFVNLCFVSGTSHPLAGQHGFNVNDLRDETLLLPKHDCSYAMQVKRLLSEEGIEVGRVIEYNSIEGIKQCLTKGIGVSVLPEIALTRPEDANLKKIGVFGDPVETAVIMIWHREKWVSESTQFFMDEARQMFSGQVIQPIETFQ